MIHRLQNVVSIIASILFAISSSPVIVHSYSFSSTKPLTLRYECKRGTYQSSITDKRLHVKKHRLWTVNFMTEKEEDEDVAAKTKGAASAKSESKQVSKKEEKERSGFWTALILGPPLLAKFGIVLLVKFLTDLVVFPLLFLYRMCRLVKIKLMGVFRKDEEGKVNGA